MQDRFMPMYSLLTKSYPVLNGKKVFFMHSLKMGLLRLVLVVSYQ